MRDPFLFVRIATFFCCASLWAQPQYIEPVLVRGELRSGQPLASEYRVELCELGASRRCRDTVTSNANFTFEAIAPGSYSLRILGIGGSLIKQEFVEISRPSAPLVVRLPENAAERPVSGTVSVRRLENPVPKAALRAFRDAVKHSEAGRREQAVEALRKAIQIFPDYGEAHNNLGVQYLHSTDYRNAADEFRRAAAIDGSAASYANLCYALSLMGQFDEAEQAGRSAVRIDPGFRKGHLVLGSVLAVKGRDQESLEHLRIASTELPRALLSMARLHWRARRTDEAIANLREYARRAPEDQKTAESWMSAIRSQRRRERL